MQATTIAEVIHFLDQIIEDAKQNNSPLGYFAALYRKVTISVRDGIKEEKFEDGSRMKRFDVIFANRYLEAYTQFQSQEQPSKSWQIAFDKTNEYWPIVLQHLLWGMNAHINLDLGIAAAEVAEGAPLEDLKNDFDTINTILAGLVEEVEQELSEIWPTLKAILKLSGNIDDFFVNFSMTRARNGAWKFATRLYDTPKEEWASKISEQDAKIAKIANLIYPPGLISRFIFRLIRVGERGTVQEKITILE
ncbi:MAG: DUF5995 family protein [Aureispira sp.]